MNRLTRLAVAVGILLLAVATVHADDVTVKTIKPDPADPAAKPTTPADPTATPAPKPPVAPAAPAASPWGVTPGSKWIDTGIMRVSLALSSAKLTDDQVEKIKAAIADIRKQMTDQNKPQQDELTKLQAEMSKNRDRDKAAEVWQQWQEIAKTMQQQADKSCPAMEEKFLPLLTDDQRKKYDDAMEESSETPAGNAKRYARSMLWKYYAAGLTEEQQTQMREVYAKKLEEFYKGPGNEDYAKKTMELSTRMFKARQAGDTKEAEALQAEYQKLTQPMTDLIKAADKEAEQLLTAEQRDKLKAANLERNKQTTEYSLKGVTLPLDELGLTDQQKAKSTELVDAARKAMDEMAPEEWMKKYELGQQLKKDIAELLTPEQQAKFKKAHIVYTYDPKAKQPKATVSFDDPPKSPW